MPSTVFKVFQNCIKNYQQGKTTNEALAGESLLSFVSFRLTSKNNIFYIDLLRVFKDVLFRLNQKNTFKEYNQNTGVAILDTDFNSEQLRLTYSEKALNITPQYFFSKENLLIKSSLWFNITLYVNIKYWFIYLLFCKKTKGLKINAALCLTEIAESSCFIQQVK